jgi:hypothetical protein
LDRSYDVVVPNKTIYVSDGDLPLYQRAQELAGDNLSAAIAAALRRYVDVEDLLLGSPIGNSGVLAVGWCIGISVVGYVWARRLYDRNPAS